MSTGTEKKPGDAEVILRVEDLKKHFPRKTKGLIRRPDSPVKAVDGIGFTLRRGETLGIVGESGCGKSTAGRTILQLLALTAGRIEYLEAVHSAHLLRGEAGQVVPYAGAGPGGRKTLAGDMHQ